jgi:hypothetical protein
MPEVHRTPAQGPSAQWLFVWGVGFPRMGAYPGTKTLLTTVYSVIYGISRTSQLWGDPLGWPAPKYALAARTRRPSKFAPSRNHTNHTVLRLSEALGTCKNFPSLRSHPLPQPFLLLIRPIPAIQPNEHRRVWERHARLQHQDVERLAGVVEPRDDLLMR